MHFAIVKIMARIKCSSGKSSARAKTTIISETFVADDDESSRQNDSDGAILTSGINYSRKSFKRLTSSSESHGGKGDSTNSSVR